MIVIADWDLQTRVHAALAGFGRPVTATEVFSYGRPCPHGHYAVAAIRQALDELVQLGWATATEQTGPSQHGSRWMRTWTYYSLGS
jgi:hypothetical protein